MRKLEYKIRIGSRKKKVAKNQKQYRVLSVPYQEKRVLILEVFDPIKWQQQKDSHTIYNKIDGKKITHNDSYGLAPLKHTDEAIELPNLIQYMRQIYKA
jgi:hypothetical protein